VSKGESHFRETDLDDALMKVSKNGQLTCSTKVSQADVFVVSVPTPLTTDLTADLSAVFDVCEELATVIQPGNLIILESTSPVGTTKEIKKRLTRRRPDLEFPESGGNPSPGCVSIAYCPERVLPGRILSELINNDRVVGGLTEQCAARAGDFYRTFVEGRCFLTDAQTAEMSKLAENAYRDLNIAYANELSVVAERLGIDAWELIDLANRHPRVNILKPGPGVGGHCIAVDPHFLTQASPEDTSLIQRARAINDARPGWVVEKVLTKIREQGRHPGDIVIACFGLTFKRDVDDLRGSPAKQVVNGLSEVGFKRLVVVEPNVKCLSDASLAPHVTLLSLDEALDGADMCVLLVDHTEFRAISSDLLDGKLIVDTRGVWCR
jgi:UDP-N-acetyl-D-mannosaminuronic acid dehydrogenase